MMKLNREENKMTNSNDKVYSLEQYDKLTNIKRHSYQEIYDMFSSNTQINGEFRSNIMCKLDAIYQFMYNCHRGNGTMMENSYGDSWQEEYNNCVTLYQRNT